MTELQPLRQQRLRCVFVADWPCHVEVEELPLEVCRLCLEARKSYASEHAKKVKRTVTRGEVLQKPVVKEGEEVRLEDLYSLDRTLMSDEISIDDYLQRRNEILRRILSGRR